MIISLVVGVILMIRGMGRIREISTSKIRKITAIRKNRRENGSRADLVGSNPHSKGDIFSRSMSVFFARMMISVMSTIMIISTSMNIVIVIIIKI